MVDNAETTPPLRTASNSSFSGDRRRTSSAYMNTSMKLPTTPSSHNNDAASRRHTPIEDVGQMFQNKTIDEIKETERDYRSHIEQKKEELRVMVGERYRDLINAADTIKDMDEESQQIHSSILSMNQSCRNIRDLHSPLKRTRSSEDEMRERSFYMLAMQMNVLVDIPEKIWTALDNGEYMVSAHLFLLAQHIVETSLHISSPSKQGGSGADSGQRKQKKRDVYASFPILHHQWAAISHFKPSIIKGASASLKDGMLSDTQLCESLCCIAILENLSPRQLCQQFLNERRDAINDVFTMQGESSKKQICDAVFLLQLTVKQMIRLFHASPALDPTDSNDALCVAMLLEIVSDEMLVTTDASQPQPTSKGLEYIFGDEVELTIRYLPPHVQSFKPKLSTLKSNITEEQLVEYCTKWIESCISEVQSGVKELLSFVSTIKGLANIRDAVHKLLLEDRQQLSEAESWVHACDRCFGKQLSIWDEFFRSLFVSRVQVICEKQLEAGFSRMLSTTRETLIQFNGATSSNELTEQTTKWDVDIASYLWFETVEEQAEVSGSYLSNQGEAPSTTEPIEKMIEKNMASQKVKAVTPAISSLCSTFDADMQALLTDLNFYTTQQTDKNQMNTFRNHLHRLLLEADILDDLASPFDKYKDVPAINDVLVQAFLAHNTKLCDEVSSILEKESHDLAESDETTDPAIVTALITRLTFIARLCMCLTELCPSIRTVTSMLPTDSTAAAEAATKAALTSPMHRVSKQVSSAKEMQVADSLEQLSIGAWSIWTEWLVSSCRHSLEQTFGCEQDMQVFSCTNWEIVEIEEEGESGVKMTSSIKVPAHASFYMTSLLYRMAEEIHRVGGHVIQRSVARQLSHDLCDCLLMCHEDMVKEGRVSDQNSSLQMIFDVKCVTQLLLQTQDNKNEVVSKLRKRSAHLVSSLERNVDPFDLDVFASHMTAFISRQVQRVGLLFGVMSDEGHTASTSSSRHAPVTGTSSSQTVAGKGKSGDTHSVVQMGFTHHRFAMLPIGQSAQQQLVQQQTSARNFQADFALEGNAMISPMYNYKLTTTVEGVV